MLRLEADSENEFVAYIRRNNLFFTATTAYYGYCFTSQLTGYDKWVLLEDNSASADSYQLFNMVVTGGTENPDEGIVQLGKEGNYNYTVYAATGYTVSDILSGDTALESGIATLINSNG